MQRSSTGGRVVEALRVAKERLITDGCVSYAGVAIQGLITHRRVEVACCAAIESLITDGRVPTAGGVEIQRIKTDGRVVEAGCVGNERILTQCCIVAA